LTNFAFAGRYWFWHRRRNGRFPLEKLVKFYDFVDVNRAIDAGRKGGV